MIVEQVVPNSTQGALNGGEVDQHPVDFVFHGLILSSMIFRHSFVLCALLAFSLSAAQSDKPVVPIPVAKELLDGQRLISKDAHCSLSLPGAGWAWMTYDGAGKNFLCVNSLKHEIYAVRKRNIAWRTDRPCASVAHCQRTQI